MLLLFIVLISIYTGYENPKIIEIPKSIVKNPKLYYGKIREAFLSWVIKPELAKYILSIEKGIKYFDEKLDSPQYFVWSKNFPPLKLF